MHTSVIALLHIRVVKKNNQTYPQYVLFKDEIEWPNKVELIDKMAQKKDEQQEENGEVYKAIKVGVIHMRRTLKQWIVRNVRQPLYK